MRDPRIAPAASDLPYEQALSDLVRLATAGQREDIARSLADRLGVEELLLFLPDPDTGTLLPAPGFRQTLPFARPFRQLLTEAVARGEASGLVADGASGSRVVLAFAGPDATVLALIGGTADKAAARYLLAFLPLVGAAFREERISHFAQVQARIAADAAAEARTLADGLEAARRELQLALLATEEARQRLEQSLQSREEFVASVAHDLRTPLTSVQGFVQLLLRRVAQGGATDPVHLQDVLVNIDQAARKMSAMIGHIIDMATLQSGRALPLERGPTDLVALLKEVVKIQQVATGRHEIALWVEPRELVGQWDASRLDRAFSNLVNNAIKYSPAGGSVRLRMWVESGMATSWAVVSVADQGLGIPAADLSRIFDRFYRGGNVIGALPGTGIGLAGARAIVEQHGGTIAVQSQEGRGTVFTVRLPLDDSLPQP